MKAYLIELHLLDIVEAATEPPTPKNDEIAFKDWSRKNALALYLIRESSRPKEFRLIGKISTAKIAWDTLTEMSKPKSKLSLSFIWEIHFRATLLICSNVTLLWEIHFDRNVQIILFI